jgi:hypothetical protein
MERRETTLATKDGTAAGAAAATIEAREPIDLDALDAELSGAQDALNALLAEQARLPGDRRAAAEAADASAWLKSHTRREDLPAEIGAARMRLIRLRIARREAELPGLSTEVLTAGKAVEAAQAAVQKAQRVLDDAVSEFTWRREAKRGAEIDLAAMKREVDEMVARQTIDPGPIVHAGWLSTGRPV